MTKPDFRRRLSRCALLICAIACILVPLHAGAWFPRGGGPVGGGGPPGDPSSLNVTQVSSTALQVTFTGGSGATNHQIRIAPQIRQVDGSNNVTWTSTGWWNATATFTSGSNLTSLDPQKGYDVQVRAVNGSGNSNWIASTGVTADVSWTDGGTATSVSASGTNAYLDGMLSGAKWTLGADKVITYSFPTNSATSFGNDGNYGAEITSGTFAPLAVSERNKIRAILAWIQQFVDVRFQEVTDDATHWAKLRWMLTNYAGVPTAHCYFPATKNSGSFGQRTAGDCWFGYAQPGNNFWGNPPYAKSTYQWAGYAHETGHGLGLSHPHDGPYTHVPSDKDSLEYSMMSYNSVIGGSHSGYTNETFGYPTTMAMLDIFALQTMYGARYDTNNADTVYAWNSATGALSVNGVADIYTPGANRIMMTIWDGGGSADKYDFTTSSYGAGTITPNVTQGACMATSTTQRAESGAGQYGCTIFNAQRFGGSTASDIESAQVPFRRRRRTRHVAIRRGRRNSARLRMAA